jgi:hypothetical protein
MKWQIYSASIAEGRTRAEDIEGILLQSDEKDRLGNRRLQKIA